MCRGALPHRLAAPALAVLGGADTFVEIEIWTRTKLDWLRNYLKREAGIPSHDTFGRLFAAIDAEEFGAALVRWVKPVMPVFGESEGVAIDAMGTQPNIARAIQDVFEAFQAVPGKTPHHCDETIEKERSQIEVGATFVL